MRPLRPQQGRRREEGDPIRTVWADHLRRIFREAGVPPGTVTEQAAEAVALYCREFHPAGLRDRELLLLAARAFCALGERMHARRLLEAMTPHSRRVDRWLEILPELDRFPRLLPYFSAGVIRPADWAGSRPDRMWTVDFSRLTLAEEDRYEMAVFRCVRVVLEALASFWDATGGEGVLGLKGMAALSGGAAQRAHLREYAEAVLERTARERKWRAVPELLDLDA